MLEVTRSAKRQQGLPPSTNTRSADACSPPSSDEWLKLDSSARPPSLRIPSADKPRMTLPQVTIPPHHGDLRRT